MIGVSCLTACGTWSACGEVRRDRGTPSRGQPYNREYPLSYLAASICPDIPRAPRHFNLIVQGKTIELPGGKCLQGYAYNSSYIGPAAIYRYATLGDTISIDVFSNA